MTRPATAPRRRSAWTIVRAMEAELVRQAREGVLAHAGAMDESGHIHVSGTIDLAVLADATERALRREFM